MGTWKSSPFWDKFDFNAIWESNPMARNMQSVSESTGGEFVLSLPPNLDIKPKFEVAVSKNFTAYVYDTTGPRYVTTRDVTGREMHAPDGKHIYTRIEEPLYLIDVRHNKLGTVPRIGYIRVAFSRTDFSECIVSHSLVNVSIALRDIAAALRPKTRVTKESSSVDDEE